MKTDVTHKRTAGNRGEPVAAEACEVADAAAGYETVDLFSLTRMLFRELRTCGPVDYNGLSQLSKVAADTLIDDDRAEITVVEGRPVLRERRVDRIGRFFAAGTR